MTIKLSNYKYNSTYAYNATALASVAWLIRRPDFHSIRKITSSYIYIRMTGNRIRRVDNNGQVVRGTTSADRSTPQPLHVKLVELIRREDFILFREITCEFIYLDFAEGKACQVDQFGKVLWHNFNSQYEAVGATLTP